MNKVARNVAHRVATFIVAGAVLAGTSTNTRADILFETGTLGPTGIPWSDVDNQTVFGANIKSNVFNGVRFQFAQPVVTTEIGGHFVGTPDNLDTFFGAIVKLDDENDFPDSGDLSTSDVLGSTIIGFPDPSAEVFGNLALSLDPGCYALVFGSGLFGAVGSGAMPLNNPDVGNPTYIGFQSGAVLGWGNLINPIFRNYRFVVHGRVVPEPSIVAPISVTLLSALLCRFRSRR